MSANAERTVTTHSPEETLAVGRRLGAALRPGDVIALTGPLGAGKTHLVKGIAEGLGLPDSREVTSPTFVLVNEYEARLPIYHFDAYRLTDADQLIEIGCDEYFAGPGVSLVEWADRVPDALPPEHLHIDIEPLGPTERVLHLRPVGLSYRDRLGDFSVSLSEGGGGFTTKDMKGKKRGRGAKER